MGQGDLFLCRRTGISEWTSPKNLGYPINTYSDEIGLSSECQRGIVAYFASDRGEGTDTDLYAFELARGAQTGTCLLYERKGI